MGVSTDAILAYGIELPEDFVERYDEEMHTKETNLLGWMAYMGKAVDGCQLVTHQSDEFPMHVLAFEGSAIEASRGNPQKIAPPELISLAERSVANKKLREFCDKHGVPWSEPAWLLFSYWG